MSAIITDKDIIPTNYQQAVLKFRQHTNILQAGGRGSGKSHGMILDLLDHCRVFGKHAAPLVVREQWLSLTELQSKVMDMACIAFGPEVKQNKAAGEIHLPTGGTISFSNILDDQSYRRLQGLTRTALYADECGAYPPQVFRLLNLIRSNIRVPNGFRGHCHFTANPGGASHALLMKRFIGKAPPFTPFEDEAGDLWIWAESNIKDNDRIDQEAYIRQLTAATLGDVALKTAWIEGKFTSMMGGMFDDLFDPSVHLIKKAPPTEYMKCIIGGDHGTRSPSAGTLLGELKQRHGHFLPGDVFVMDERCTCDPHDWSRGLGDPPTAVACMFLEMAAANQVRRPECVMDDARGLMGDTVVQMFNDAGLPTEKPYAKDRKGTWALIRERLYNAREGEGRPGLYFVAGKTPHLCELLPEAPRNPRNRDDLDPGWQLDHHIDSCGYGLRAISQGLTKGGSGKVTGYF